MAACGGPSRQGVSRLAEPLLGLLALVLVGVGAWAMLGSSFATDGGAPGRDDTALRASVTRGGEQARVTIIGSTRRGGAGAPVAVHVIGRSDVAAPCPTPAVAASTRLVGPPGALAWRPLSVARPGRALRRGRPFAMAGAVALPGSDALRLCAYLVRGGRRPVVLRSVGVVAPNASGITPLAVAAGSLGGRVPGTVLAALAVLGLAGLPVRLARRHWPLRTSDGGGEAVLDLPPWPTVPPWSRPPGVKRPPPVPPPDHGNLRSTAAAGVRWLARWWRLRRAAAAADASGEPDASLPPYVRAWSARAQGERLAVERFERIRDAFPGVEVRHDRRQRGRRQANVDHLLVGPAGVVVADTKNWAGAAEVVDGRLRVAGRDRTKAIEGVLRQVDGVRAVLDAAGLGVVPIAGALHWIQADEGALDGSLVLWEVPLLDAPGVMGLAGHGSLLGGEEIAQVVRTLELALPPT